MTSLFLYLGVALGALAILPSRRDFHDGKRALDASTVFKRFGQVGRRRDDDSSARSQPGLLQPVPRDRHHDRTHPARGAVVAPGRVRARFSRPRQHGRGRARAGGVESPDGFALGIAALLAAVVALAGQARRRSPRHPQPQARTPASHPPTPALPPPTDFDALRLSTSAPVTTRRHPTARTGRPATRTTQSPAQELRPARTGERARRVYGAVAAAAALAAAGSAARMRSISVDSWAAETNQASNTDGGSETPASSIAWKNGA